MSKNKKDSKKQKFDSKEQARKSSSNSKHRKERRLPDKKENFIHAGINPDI